MMNRYGDADAYEEAMKNQFCAGDIDILIVCSKPVSYTHLVRTVPC